MLLKKKGLDYEDVLVSGDKAYVTDTETGLNVVDLADPQLDGPARQPAGDGTDHLVDRVVALGALVVLAGSAAVGLLFFTLAGVYLLGRRAALRFILPVERLAGIAARIASVRRPASTTRCHGARCLPSRR